MDSTNPKLLKRCQKILRHIWAMPESLPFREDATVQFRNCPNPTSLRSIGDRLDSKSLSSPSQFHTTLQIVFQNAITYSVDQDVVSNAEHCKDIFEDLYIKASCIGGESVGDGGGGDNNSASSSSTNSSSSSKRKSSADDMNDGDGGGNSSNAPIPKIPKKQSKIFTPSPSTNNYSNNNQTSTSDPTNQLLQQQQQPYQPYKPPHRVSPQSNIYHPNQHTTFLEKTTAVLNLLQSYIIDCGGAHDALKGWTVTVEARKEGKTQGTSDMYYFNPVGKKFRSRAEVARYFNLAAAPPKRQNRDGGGKGGGGGGGGKKKTTLDSERKRMQKDIDRMVSLKAKIEVRLSESETGGKRSIYPVDESVMTLKEDGFDIARALPLAEGFGMPYVEEGGVGELVGVWDFLTMFHRTLLLNVIDLDSFGECMTFGSGNSTQLSSSSSSSSSTSLSTSTTADTSSEEGDLPIYIAEAHISILRLLLADETSDSWWFGDPTKQTLEEMLANDTFLKNNSRNRSRNRNGKKRHTADTDTSMIHLDLKSVLAVEEDISVMRRWIHQIEDIRNRKTNSGGPIRSSIRKAIATTTNAHVKNFLTRSLKRWKGNAAGVTKRAAIYLVDAMMEARPGMLVMSAADIKQEGEREKMESSAAAAAASTNGEVAAAVAPAVSDDAVIPSTTSTASNASPQVTSSQSKPTDTGVAAMDVVVAPVSDATVTSSTTSSPVAAPAPAPASSDGDVSAVPAVLNADASTSSTTSETPNAQPQLTSSPSKLLPAVAANDNVSGDGVVDAMNVVVDPKVVDATASVDGTTTTTSSADATAEKPTSKYKDENDGLEPTANSDDDVDEDHSDSNDENNNNSDNDNSDSDSDSDSNDEQEPDSTADLVTAVEDDDEDKDKKPSTIADLLLASSKPLPSDVTALTYNFYAGIVASRILARFIKKRVESDEDVRKGHMLPPLTKDESTLRAKDACLRLYPNAIKVNDDGSSENVLDAAIEHLANGNAYAELTCNQRVCVLRVLVDAAYDTTRILGVVEDNCNSRTNAEKTLENDAKVYAREEKEIMRQVEEVAKEQIQIKAEADFFERKREELRSDVNYTSKPDYDKDVLDNMTGEAMLDNFEFVRVQFDNVHASRYEVSERARQLYEASLLGCDSVTIYSIAELEGFARESQSEEEDAYAEDNDDIDALDVPESYVYHNPDIYTRDRVAQLRARKAARDKMREKYANLPVLRQQAISQLTAAFNSDSAKALLKAIKHATSPSLDLGLEGRTAADEANVESIFFLDVLRDCKMMHVNMVKEMRRKEGIESLMANREECFVRTMPLGLDRGFRRFWCFGNDWPRVWVEDCVLTEEDEVAGRSESYEEVDIKVQAEGGDYKQFARQEYHANGGANGAVKSKWSYYVSEGSVNELVECMDGRGKKEEGLIVELHDNIKHRFVAGVSGGNDNDGEETTWQSTLTDVQLLSDQSKGVARGTSRADRPRYEQYASETAVGKRVRSHVPDVGCINGTVTGFIDGEDEGMNNDGDDNDDDNSARKRVKGVALWHILNDDTSTSELPARTLIESRVKFYNYTHASPGYTEPSIYNRCYTYRNTLGKFCGGKASDVMPNENKAQVLVKMVLGKEQVMYTQMKGVCGVNSWGGKEGMRNGLIAMLRGSNNNSASAAASASTADDDEVGDAGEKEVGQECEQVRDVEVVREGLVKLEEGMFAMSASVVLDPVEPLTTADGDADADGDAGTDNADVPVTNTSTIATTTVAVVDEPWTKIQLTTPHALDAITLLLTPLNPYTSSPSQQQQQHGIWPNVTARNAFRGLVNTTQSISVLTSCLEVLGRNCGVFAGVPEDFSGRKQQQRAKPSGGRERKRGNDW